MPRASVSCITCRPGQGTRLQWLPWPRGLPSRRQRLSFVASGAGGRWRLDGKPLGQGTRLQWLPWPGRHVMQLTDARGTVLDEVRFEVRGAGVKEHARSH